LALESSLAIPRPERARVTQRIGMLKDPSFWTAWEAQGPLRERFSPSRALALGEAMYEYARSLGVFPPDDRLAGIETKISLARTVNVPTAPGKAGAGS
jgi:hypothetical protein